MLIVGTSATVQPAATLPMLALQHGAALVEVNPEATPLQRARAGLAARAVRAVAAGAGGGAGRDAGRVTSWAMTTDPRARASGSRHTER